MSVYVAEMTATQAGTNFTNMVLTPGVLPIKILKVEFTFSSTGPNIYRSVGTGTGGTSLTPSALRSAAPASVATVKYGATSVSGTPVYYGSGLVAGASPYQPVSSLIISAGSVFVVAAASLSSVYIHFDELEIQPGF